MAANKIFIILGSCNTLACIQNFLGVMTSYTYKKTIGFSNGFITNRALFEQFITEILIELKAHEQTVKDVVLVLYGKIMHTNVVKLPLQFSTPKIIDHTVEKKISSMCKHWCQEQKRYLLHMSMIESTLDGEYVSDPIGLKAQDIQASMQLFSADCLQMDNLLDIFKNLFLNVIDIVPMPLVWQSLIDKQDMKELGMLVLDFGGQTLTITGFYQNKLLFVDQLNIGGDLLTRKLAQIFNISLEEAERLKCIYGSAISAPQDAYEWLEIPLLSGKMLCMNKSKIVEIIAEYMEDMIKNIQQRLKQLDIPAHIRKRVVLVGQFAKMQKLATLISESMNCECEMIEKIDDKKFILEGVMSLYKTEIIQLSWWEKLLQLFKKG